MLDKRFLKNFDWITFSLVIVLSIISVITIYSATRNPLDNGMDYDFYWKQIVWLLLGIIAMVIASYFNYSWIKKVVYYFYGITLALLVTVVIIGKLIMGGQRWLNLGIFSFQPSELFKVSFIIALSSYLCKLGNKPAEKISVLALLFLGIIPFFLLIIQPDLGTTLLFCWIFATLFLFKGISKKVLVTILIVILISIPFLGHIFWYELKDYQKNRIIAFIDPDVDPSGINYHLNQSQISIGSGMVLGKGFLKGTQGPFKFLPEKHTDFIFAIFAEEWGFLGCIILLSVYLFLFLQGVNIALQSKDEFGRLVSIGITTMFFVYFVFNIGMTLGLTPVVGIPLPFLSYGGTALISNFIAVGILINIHARRFELFY